MSIQPLPGDVVAQLKSAVAIASPNHVVCGLVANALDARAARINVTVDYARGNCAVEDNGVGIPPSEFGGGGGLGQLHCTSKHPPQPGIHGRHGVFLAAVGALSLLSVASHHQDHHSHNSMTIHNSHVLARHTPCPPEHRLLTFPHGTRVTARDLFGSMPVRVKHRALQAERSAFARDWDRLLLAVVALLIPWPGTVAVSIRESSTRQSVTLRTGPQPRQWTSDGCRLLHQAGLCDSPDTSNWVAIGASAPGLCISGYVCRDPVATKRLQFISLGIEPLSNESRCNVLYEQVNTLFADSSFGALEDASDSGQPRDNKSKTDGFANNRELRARKGVDRWPMFFLKIVPTTTHVQNRPLEVDDIIDDRQPNLLLLTDLLKAVFREFLRKNHCRPKTASRSTNPKSMRHGSSQPAQKKAPLSQQDAQRTCFPSANSASSDEYNGRNLKSRTADGRLEPSFAALSRIKSGQPLHTFEQLIRPKSTPAAGNGMSKSSQDSQQAPLYDAKGKLTRQPFEDVDACAPRSRRLARERNSMECETEQRTQNSQPRPDAPVQDGTFDWVNPTTKASVTVNSRTGFVMAPKPLTLTARANENRRRSPGRDGGNVDPEAKETAPWIRDLVRNWKNPVFELTEAPIPRLPDVSETLGLPTNPAADADCGRGRASFSVGTRHEASVMGLQGRLSKNTLQHAQVLSQVDRKFILVKLQSDHAEADESVPGSTPPSPVMVLIDQHAADERCRVEGLMGDYFKPVVEKGGKCFWKAVTEPLPKPVRFELPGRDGHVLGRCQAYFRHWGIFYDVVDSAAGVTQGGATSSRKMSDAHGSGRAIIIVRSLPPAILERCRTESRLLVDIIRKEAWRLNDEDGLAYQPRPRPFLREEEDDDGDVPVWVSLLHGCPQGIVELINSRSCRSAIMFNDPLTPDQCHDLVARLVRCAFPFQCAHGRPSMVPLVDLGGGETELGNLVVGGGRGEAAKEEAFWPRYKRWKRTRG